MAMLSLLRNYPGHALASAFKLRPSVLPLSYVATRHFMATSPDYSPAQKAGKEASSKPSTVYKSDGKPDVGSKTKSADLEKQDKPPKPKRITKKDLTPPTKRPLSSFATFALECRAKQLQDTNTPTPVPLADSLRDAAAAWTNLSEAEKQTYAPSREAVEAHRIALKNWQGSLSVEAKKALKLRRRRKRGTGYALFVSESFNQAVGDTFGDKISNRAASWKSLSSEAKAAYMKRATETLFGVRAERAAQHERQLKREAKEKAEAKDKKEKEKAQKQKEQAKKKTAQAKLRKATTMQAKKEKAAVLKRKLEAKKSLETMKQVAKHGKKTVKKATT